MAIDVQLGRVSLHHGPMGYLQTRQVSGRDDEIVPLTAVCLADDLVYVQTRQTGLSYSFARGDVESTSGSS